MSQHKKSDYMQFMLVEVDEILQALADIIKQPDIVEVPVTEASSIRMFLHKYNPIAADEIIRSLGDRLGIELDPNGDVSMKAIATKLRS